MARVEAEIRSKQCTVCPDEANSQETILVMANLVMDFSFSRAVTTFLLRLVNDVSSHFPHAENNRSLTKQ
jgi:hypothetical protein